MTRMPNTEKHSRDEKALLDAVLGDGKNTKGEVVTHKKPGKKKAETLVNFQDIEGKLTFEDKPPEKWNKVDLRHYFETLYKNLFGARSPFTIVFFYQKTNEVSRKLAEALRIAEVPPPLMKEFYDWYFAVHIQKVVAKFNFFRLEWMGKEWITREFAETREAPPAPPEQAPELPLELEGPGISVDDIDAKAKVSFQSVLLSYGVVVAVNWAVKFKGVPVAKAVAVVEKAAAKAVQSDRRFWVNIVSATERHGPYPKSLVWSDANAVTAAVEKAVGGKKLKRIVVESCEQNGKLDPLRNT